MRSDLPLAMPDALLNLCTPTLVGAAVQTQAIEYRDGETILIGHLICNDSRQDPRPGVRVIHEWWGLNDDAKRRAEMLAELGDVAFCGDMDGDGRVTRGTPNAQGRVHQTTASQDAWQRRSRAGRNVLAAQERVDPDKIAAVGNCFGGAMMMQLAGAAADFDGIVSIHGSRLPATGFPAGSIEPSILISDGEVDRFVLPERTTAFKNGLDVAQPDRRMVTYAEARHGFTTPGRRMTDSRPWGMIPRRIRGPGHPCSRSGARSSRPDP
jgi:dienelactone hydrolase